MKTFLNLIIIFLTLCTTTFVYTKNFDSTQIDALKSQFLPPEYRNTNFTIDDIKKIFHEKCKKATGSRNATLYKEIEDGAVTFKTCIADLANVTQFQEEIDIARPIGEMDTVFHKYCQKVPEFEKCLRNFNAKVQSCLTKSERTQNIVLMRVVGSLLNFMCSRGGDQMALFVAEQGPECLEANKEAITSCANHSFIEYWPKDNRLPDIFNLPEIILSPEHCVDFERFERCTLHHLQQCRDITPANVAESVFRFVKNETTCRSWIDAKAKERSVLKDTRDGGAATLQSLSFVLLVGAGILIANFRL